MQITRYLKGELDAKAMHELEMQAQDDPFLMDALLGYEHNDKDQRQQLDELSDLLRQRISKPVKGVISWKVLAVAASVLIILSIGGLFLYNHYEERAPVLTMQVKPAIKEPIILPGKSPAENKNLAAYVKPAPGLKKTERPAVRVSIPPVSVADAAVSEQVATADEKNTGSTDKDTMPLNEMIVMGYTPQKKKDTTGVMHAVESDSKIKSRQNQAQVQLLEAQAAGVTKTSSPGISPIGYNLPLLKEVVIGRVTGRDDGMPLPGATVHLAGTNISTVTDKDGKFKLRADSTKNRLIIASIGYQTREINLHNRDSLKKIALEPANSSLNEVVVTGYTAKNKNEDTVLVAAHPKTGWGALKKYLKENAVSPDGKTGVVNLSFEVAYNGSISEIQVVNGLSAAANQKAVDLIKNGPLWLGNTSGKPETIKLKIKF